MNFSKPCVDCNSGRATPFLRRNPRTATRNEPNPAECHLSFAGNCSDNRSQLLTTQLFKLGNSSLTFKHAMYDAEYARLHATSEHVVAMFSPCLSG